MTHLNGVHDLGGMHGFGAVVREANEPVFHADWERRMAAIFAAMSRVSSLDARRHAIERMPPARYLASSYYERWLFSIETLLAEAGIVTPDEIEAAQNRALDSTPAPPATATEAPPILRPPEHAVQANRGRSRARFKIGDHIVARNMNPPGHTRLPRYARGKHGVVRRDWGVFPLADDVAHGRGPNSQHCYNVEFTARELWGAGYPARERVFIDLWEDYLEPDRKAMAASRKTNSGSRAIGERATPAKKPAKPGRQGKR